MNALRWTWTIALLVAALALSSCGTGNGNHFTSPAATGGDDTGDAGEVRMSIIRLTPDSGESSMNALTAS